jgi:hypothetical protein
MIRDAHYCLIIPKGEVYDLVGVGHMTNSQDTYYCNGATLEQCLKMFRDQKLNTWCTLYIKVIID